MRGMATHVRFSVPGVSGNGVIEVIGEHREIPMVEGHFSDHFASYGVHLYRVKP